MYMTKIFISHIAQNRMKIQFESIKKEEVLRKSKILKMSLKQISDGIEQKKLASATILSSFEKLVSDVQHMSEDISQLASLDYVVQNYLFILNVD